MRERIWKIGDEVVDLSKRGMIMVVLNVTPDSFSDGGEFFEPDAAIVRGVQIASEGADIIDVGGESTHPGTEPVSVKEELRRVIPVIEKLRAKIDIPISIDTSKSEVASAALDAGASIINDVMAGRGGGETLAVAGKRANASVSLDMQREPRTMQNNLGHKEVIAARGGLF